MGTDPSNITAKSNNQSKQTKINISKGSHPKHTYSTGKATIIKHKTSSNLHFSYENICQYAKSLWRFPQQSRLLDVSLSPIRNVGRLCSEA